METIKGKADQVVERTCTILSNISIGTAVFHEDATNCRVWQNAHDTKITPT